MSLLFCVHFRDERSFRRLLAFVVFGSLVGALAMLTSPGVRASLESYTRVAVASEIAGERTDIHALARTISIGLLSCIFLLIVSKGFLLRAVIAVVSMVLAMSLVVAKGRSVYLMFPLSVLGAFVLCKGAGLRRRLLIGLVIILMMVAVILVGDYFNVWGPGVSERFESIFLELRGRGKGHGVESRFGAWRGYLTEMVRTGFIGRGFKQAGFSGAVAEEVGHGMVAHNNVIEIAGDYGIVGVFCFVGLQIHLFRRILRMKQIWHKFFLLMLWLFINLAGMTQTDYRSKYFGLTLAIIFVVLRMEERQRGEEAYAPPGELVGVPAT
jgi:hypothetical protein